MTSIFCEIVRTHVISLFFFFSQSSSVCASGFIGQKFRDVYAGISDKACGEAELMLLWVKSPGELQEQEKIG